MQLPPFAAPPGLQPGASESPADQALMHGLAKGLEGLLGVKPVPPGPRIVCGLSPTCHGIVHGTVHGSVTRLPARIRPAQHQDGGPRSQDGAQVVRLPVRSRKPVFATSVKRTPELRLVRL